MASERPPLDRLTANDTGAAVLVVVYTLALLSVVVSIIHFWNAIARKTKLGFDDAAYILANVRVCPSARPPFSPRLTARRTSSGP